MTVWPLVAKYGRPRYDCGHLWPFHDIEEYDGDGSDTCCVEGCDQSGCPGGRCAGRRVRRVPRPARRLRPAAARMESERHVPRRWPDLGDASPSYLFRDGAGA